MTNEGTTIENVPLVSGELSGNEKIPASNGTKKEIAVSVDQITRYVEKKVKPNIEYNKQMPIISIDGEWSFLDFNDNQKNPSEIYPTPNSRNPVLEFGYKAKFSGTYMWKHGVDTKNPTGVTSDSTFRDLPKEGVNSLTYSSSVLSANNTIKAKIYAPKTGLIVVNGTVQPATGNDTTEASVSVVFRHRRYNGVATSNVASEGLLQGLSASELVTGRGTTINGITANGSQYYVYAYPSSLGDLSSIIQDGATPVLGAFKKSTVQLTNAAGKQIQYNVYISNNRGAFTNASLKFM